MSPEQHACQLRLNKKQRIVAEALLDTNMEPFEVSEIVATTAEQEVAFGLICSVIDKLILNDLIDGWNGRLRENGSRAYLYAIKEEGHQALEEVKPTRVESAIGTIASMWSISK